MADNSQTDRTPPGSVQPIGSAIEAAIRLHDFIRSNAGETADWPLQITATDPGVLLRFECLLKEFRAAVMETPNDQAHA
jgi:hypothetical protein